MKKEKKIKKKIQVFYTIRRDYVPIDPSFMVNDLSEATLKIEKEIKKWGTYSKRQRYGGYEYFIDMIIYALNLETLELYEYLILDKYNKWEKQTSCHYRNTFKTFLNDYWTEIPPLKLRKILKKLREKNKRLKYKIYYWKFFFPEELIKEFNIVFGEETFIFKDENDD